MSIQKLIGIGISIFIGILVILIIIGSSSTPTTQKKQIKKKPTCLEACIMSETYIKSILTSPSTAEFSNCRCAGKYPIYIIYGEVDSQNGFGAMIRSEYIVNKNHLGGECFEMKNWNLNILVFNGEIVYLEKK